VIRVRARRHLAWCFHDEGTAQTWAVLDPLHQESAVVPSLWHLETANVLTLAERRGRLSEAATATFVNLVQRLPIAVDPENIRARFARDPDSGAGKS
jgi:hypothetical protein